MDTDNSLIESALSTTWPPERFPFNITVAREHAFVLVRVTNGREAACRYVYNPHEDAVVQVLRLVAEVVE